MENTYNIIHVDFKGERIAQKYNLWQYDYNQILQISGLSLPAAVEIHFSLTEKSGKTETRVVTTKNGITQVQIPNELLRNDGKSGNYSIFAFIYVVDEDSGNTEYEIILHVKSRPAPGEIGEDPEEKRILDEAVNAVNAAAGRAETAEAEARSAADSATAAAESARKSAEAVAQEKNTAISAIQDQQAAAEKAITDHTDAEIGRQNAATKEATDALIGQITKAGTADSELKATAEDAGRKKTELKASIQDAVTAKGKVDKSTKLADTAKKNLDKSVQEASDQKSALDESTENAVKVKEELEDATNNIHDGKSAYEYAQDGGYTGTEEEFAEKLATEYLTDVRIGGESIVEDNVANIPYAGFSEFGITSIWTGYGLDILSNKLMLAQTTEEKIADRNDRSAEAVNLINLDFAVKSAMCDGKGTAWTADEQAAARERMGAYRRDYRLIADITLDQESSVLVVEKDADGKDISLRKAKIFAFSPAPRENSKNNGYVLLNNKPTYYGAIDWKVNEKNSVTVVNIDIFGGIAPATVKFVSAHNPGIAVTKNIVMSMGNKLDYYNEINEITIIANYYFDKGTRFIIIGKE